MNIAELIELIKQKAESVDFGIDLQATITTIVNEATQALTAKNSELLTKLTAAKSITNALPEDYTLETWTQMKSDLKDVDVSKLKTDDAVAAVKTQMSAAHKIELDARNKKVEDLTVSLKKHMLNGAASSALTAAGGNEALMLPHVLSHLSMIVNDAGEHQVAVLGADNQQRFSMKNAGSFMQIPELVEELKGKDMFKAAFTAENSGGGAESRRTGNEVNPWVKTTQNLTEQAKIQNTNPALAKTMQDSATQINLAAEKT